jgi:hypothetical protein
MFSGLPFLLSPKNVYHAARANDKGTLLPPYTFNAPTLSGVDEGRPAVAIFKGAACLPTLLRKRRS